MSRKTNQMKLAWIVGATLLVAACASTHQSKQTTRNQVVAVGVLTIIVIGAAVLWFGTEGCDEMTGYCPGDVEIPESHANER